MRALLATPRRVHEMWRQFYGTIARGELRHGFCAARFPPPIDRRRLRVQLSHDHRLLLARLVHANQDRIRSRQQSENVPPTVTASAGSK